VPGTPSHEACANYMVAKLEQYKAKVQVQTFSGRVYDARIFPGKNIIASYQPEKKARIMLAAHWDSRPFADHDPDPAKRNQPVMAANDGASGVGILLEVARLLSQSNPNVGVDIVFFDLEDFGPPQDKQDQATEHWGLGSQYWSANPHVYGYSARFCILLDMVGAKDAVFRQEGFSAYYAPDKLKKVWDIAHNLGYSQYFLYEEGSYINDDHYYINEIRKMPAIDIIHLDPNSSNGSFYEYWHTTGDTFDKIDKGTVEVVGKVVTQTVYSEN
jgi:Zn-dependent M28 family amino/carboxypeptidase